MELIKGLFCVTCLVVLFLVVFKFYLKLTTVWCLSPTCLVGKTAIVTGANTGLGYETALDFAKRGARVILACRNEEKARAACRKIKELTGNADIHWKLVDCASLESVRKFANEINRTERRLDILVNNAAACFLRNEITDDGLEITTQVNYLSLFLLTNLLLDLLKKTPSSRVVNVSSYTALTADTNLDNINAFRKNQYVKYATTKLYIILFTITLAEKLANTGVTTYSVHPGTTVTEIYRNLPEILRVSLKFVLYCFVKTPVEGAQTQIYCSVQKGIEQYSGEVFHECRVVNRYFNAKDDAMAKRLWDMSLKLVHLD